MYDCNRRVVDMCLCVRGPPLAIHSLVDCCNSRSSLLSQLGSNTKHQQQQHLPFLLTQLRVQSPINNIALLQAAGKAAAAAEARQHRPVGAAGSDSPWTPRGLPAAMPLAAELTPQKRSGGGFSTSSAQTGGRGRVSVLDDILRRRLRPTILVPREETATVNLGNFRSLVEGGMFQGQSAEAAGVASGSLLGSSGYNIKQDLRGKCVKFRVIDTTTAAKRFDANDWLSVVCVVITGKVWQLDKWPFPSIEVACKAAKPFFFCFQEVPPPPLVARVNATVIQISRTQRHTDVAVRSDFWNALEGFLALPCDSRPSAQLPP